ncbi:MAG: hypothetical protein A3G18_03270 [Rhodospirillales bacterium RIFCSPLOWO2_12_FULL_58_28]|nr:MAG: hypothetical protein A3H92_03215 [Rhodospirillales bacterium RIFCSPLOWO2_02_FULL_58_16]OHC77298.1 MAG: hypothetical protein A3G18_03270 [Rhodospirillales bacterium RIFCSPLOWO2_12_FULL_58_28]
MPILTRLSLPWLSALRTWRLFSGGGGVRILLFHDTPRDGFEDFGRFVKYVKQTHGILSPQEAAARLAGGGEENSKERTPCLFTFDDGFASNFELASEVLASHGVTALFFVCPGLIGLGADEQSRLIAANIFDGRRQAAGKRLMSWDEIAELKSGGHVIGAHGMNHLRLTKLSGEALGREILDSGVQLEDRLGDNIDWYAYAFGDIDSISVDALKIISQKFRFCRSGVRGVNFPTTDLHALRADHVEMTAPAAYRKLIVEGGLQFRYAGARRRLDEMVS